MIQLSPQHIPFYNRDLKTSIPFTSKREFVDLFKHNDFISKLPSKNDPNNEILTVIDKVYQRFKQGETLEISDCLRCLCEYNHNHKIVFTKKIQFDKNKYLLLAINDNIQTWDSNGAEITVSEAYIQTVNSNLQPADCSDIYIAVKETPIKPLRILGKEITLFQDHESKLIELAQAVCQKQN